MQSVPGLSPTIQAAMTASQADDSAQAISLLQQAIAANDSPAIAQFLLGSEYAALGQMDDAEASFANALLVAPDFHVVRYQLGLLQFSSGRASLALVTWQPLVHLPENDPMRAFVYGFAALANDDFAQAISYFESGMAMNTSNPAMNGDIQKVIQKIRELPAMADAEPSPGEAATDAEVAPDNHVLLSNYTQRQDH